MTNSRRPGASPPALNHPRKTTTAYGGHWRKVLQIRIKYYSENIPYDPRGCEAHCFCTNTVGLQNRKHRGLTHLGEWRRRVPFQKHVGSLSLSLLCHWDGTALKPHSSYCYSNELPGKKKKKEGGQKNNASMHACMPQKLICRARWGVEPEQPCVR